MKDFFTYIYLDFPRSQFSAEGIFLDRGIPGHHRGSNWDQASLENNFREPVSPRRGKTLYSITARARKTKTKSGKRAHPKVRSEIIGVWQQCSSKTKSPGLCSTLSDRDQTLNLLGGCSNKYGLGLSPFV